MLSLFFQHVLGESAVLAGLMFLPMTALLAGANLASAKTAARTGHHVPVRAGLLVSALGMLALALASTGTDRGPIVLALIPMGVGLGFALPSLTVVMPEAIPADQAGLAAGVLNSSRQTGGALAVAVFGVLVSRSPGTFASFTPGMRDGMLIAAVLLAGSTAAAFAVLRRHGRAV